MDFMTYPVDNKKSFLLYNLKFCNRHHKSITFGPILRRASQFTSP